MDQFSERTHIFFKEDEIVGWLEQRLKSSKEVSKAYRKGLTIRGLL